MTQYTVREIQGVPQTFNLIPDTSGEKPVYRTLRLKPREVVTITEESLSVDLKKAAEKRFVIVEEVTTPYATTATTTEEVE